MRIYKPLSDEQRNKLSQIALKRSQEEYPIGTRLRLMTIIGHVRMVCQEAKTSRSYWALKCRCDCGKETIVRASTVAGKGRSESCGCEGIRKRTEASRRVWMLPPGEAAARSAFSNFCSQAKDRKIKVALTFDQFKVITKQVCRYCGQVPSQVYGATAKRVPRLNGVYVHNGIDRIDSLKGYTEDNCLLQKM